MSVDVASRVTEEWNSSRKVSPATRPDGARLQSLRTCVGKTLVVPVPEGDQPLVPSGFVARTCAA